MCCSKTDNPRKQRINYLDAAHSEEEESEPEEVQQVTQINKILPDKNDNYDIKLKIKGKISKLYHRYWISGHNHAKHPETIQPKRHTPTERKIPGCEQEWDHIPGKKMGEHRKKRQNHKTTNTHHTKRRHYTTAG